MIKTFCKLFYNKILSICYDTQKNSQDDIIIDFNKYDNINIDYKIQKKTDFYNGDFIENDLLNNTFIKDNNYHTTNLNNKDTFENYLLNTNTFINETDTTNLIDKDIFENNLSDIHNENSYDNCKSKDDYSDIDDKYDKISDID
tara:strand:- start:9514 stop:9945 length:432 start_codon:yes stop_codon:yes gene_type:complete